jgi:hypothetical protein
MANWYTDNITGNDSTGNGTIATPYKTIRKAYEVAANDDTINVAGSGWSAVTGTVTPTAFAVTTLTTSTNLTSELPAGTLISFKDTAGFGNRKIIYKVNSITATTITLNTQQYYEPGVQYEIEKVTTNYYTIATNVVVEDMTGVAYEKSGIQIEGGWVDNFTAQTGITAMVNTSVTQTGTGFRWATTATQNNPALNNFCFGSLTAAYTFTATVPGAMVYIGNMWLAGSNSSNASAGQSIPGKECNLYLTGGFTGSSNPTHQSATRWNIDNVYITAGFFSSVRQPILIDNLWQRAYGTSSTTYSSGTTSITNAIINNWNTVFRSTAATQAQAMTSGSGYYIIKNVTQTGDLTNKLLTPSIFVDNTQFINESLNVESFNFKNTPASPNVAITQQRCMARDIEGDKVLWQNAYWLYVDSTVYDTGTNSLRIKPTNQTSLPWAPIKSVYIPEGSTTAKTVTVRAKATTNINCIFGLGMNGNINQAESSICFQSISATNSLTTAWTDFIFTLTSGQITQYAGSYLQIGLQANSVTSQHIWIDSVTIS